MRKPGKPEVWNPAPNLAVASMKPKRRRWKGKAEWMADPPKSRGRPWGKRKLRFSPSIHLKISNRSRFTRKSSNISSLRRFSSLNINLNRPIRFIPLPHFRLSSLHNISRNLNINPSRPRRFISLPNFHPSRCSRGSIPPNIRPRVIRE